MDRVGRYKILGELGRGAMGVVYHAIDPSIGRSVAIKTIRIQDIHEQEHRDKLRTRLFREARSAGVLSHPNIVTIYDMDEDDGLAYIAMAFVNGPTLEKILNSRQALSGSVMLRILKQTAAALDYAHSKGIVHRDVKPANIMTDEDGAVKITDFGIAKFTDPERNTDTRTITGTPNYMSPEQVQGKGIDGRSDQFSLAVIAYEILTGERPFVGEAIGTVVYKIVAEDPAPAHRLNGTLTEQIDAVLRRALSKKVEDRFATCAEFVGTLSKACGESRGWKTVAADTSGHMPTASFPISTSPKQTVLPPTDDAVPVAARVKMESPSFVIPLLLSLMVVGGVGAVVAHQMGWQPFGAEVTAAAPVVPQPAQLSPELSQQQPSVDVTVQPKPSPLPQLETDARHVEQIPVAPKPEAAPVEVDKMAVAAKTEASVARSPRLEDVWVTSNPAGAKATLDDNFMQSCQTPCTLRAGYGRHRVMISLAGFISEIRDVAVEGNAVDIPPVTLRQPNGNVMVTSNPTGALVLVDGRIVPQRTPANLSLTPGDHVVAVERNGQRIEKRFDVGAGSLKPWSVNFLP